jgi:hypothetical protein
MDSERSALLHELALAENEKATDAQNARLSALADMSWALLTGKEFMFNH